MSFPWPDPGTPLADVITPMPVIDEARVAANIAAVQAHMDKIGLLARPHVKTHKLPHLARAQIAAGAIGITCQKLTEAEVFADVGLDDILITYNILGAARLRRLAALNTRIDLTVVADSAEVVAGLATAGTVDRPLRVLVECDTGANRCGVTTPDQALALAQRIAAHPTLRFHGIMTYPAKGGVAEVEAFFRQTMGLLAAAGLDCPVRSAGGSPHIWQAGGMPSATEYRAGTCIYNDRAQVRAGACTLDDLALSVQVTVVSRPTPDRAVLDAGSKALTNDLSGFDTFGALAEYPEARIVSLSEEHAVVDLSACATRPAIGEIVHVLPNHVCPVTNLFDRVVFHQGGVVTRVVPVAARGTVW
ncbi:alanine racemase [Falsirhodobacter halotolerans]|uniref:alanine racemase n=1 Tax=Falsirhodobacter halotolerans TaxID=1146892 RepID=UPI001FD6148E|nr:alanine racemase [Falsirhodobacter halotolerans]MCJ8141265.1 alanine racemase [Falsirhodobacter halotolerans]